MSKQINNKETAATNNDKALPFDSALLPPFSHSQSGNGLQLTGEVLLQLTTQANFTQLASRYNLQLKHRVGDIVVVTTATNNIQQLVQQLTQEPTIKQASFDLRELGLSADPQIKNEDEN